MAFRGGTALHKITLDSPLRYSEDIDLVQIEDGPIGADIDAIRTSLQSWLGEPQRKQTQGRVTLLYRFESSALPIQSMRLKVEINTREHFAVLGIRRQSYSVTNPWFTETVEIPTFHVEELLGTKLRALYQRKKGRDLYDLWMALSTQSISDDDVVRCFEHYMAHDDLRVSRAQFERNLAEKLMQPAFADDVIPLLPTGVAYDPHHAATVIRDRLLARLSGDSWKSKSG